MVRKFNVYVHPNIQRLLYQFQRDNACCPNPKKCNDMQRAVSLAMDSMRAVMVMVSVPCLTAGNASILLGPNAGSFAKILKLCSHSNEMLIQELRDKAVRVQFVLDGSANGTTVYLKVKAFRKGEKKPSVDFRIICQCEDGVVRTGYGGNFSNA